MHALLAGGWAIAVLGYRTYNYHLKIDVKNAILGTLGLLDICFAC
jgi:hypothetical protein